MSRLLSELAAPAEHKRSAAQGMPSQPESEFQLETYLAALRRRWLLVVLAVSICVAGGVIHFVITPKAYRATAQVQIERKSLTAATGEYNPWIEGFFGLEFYPTQYQLLKSRGLAERTVRYLRLWEDPDFFPAARVLDKAGSSKAKVTAEDDLAMLGRLANRLRGGLDVDPVRDTQLVNISYTASTPALAAKIANGVVDSYIQMGISTRSSDATRASGFLETEIANLKQKIADKRSELQAYDAQRHEAGLESPGTQVSAERLSQLNGDHTSAVNDRIAKKATLDRLNSTPDRQLVNLSASGSLGDLNKQLLADQRQYDAMSKTYKPDWPQMVDLKSRIDQEKNDLEKLIANQADSIRNSARSDYQAALSREQALAAELRRASSSTLEVQSAEIDYNTLQSEIQSLQKELDDKQQRLVSMGTSSRVDEAGGSNVRVIDRALVPGGPFRPSLRKDLTTSIGLGLLLGIGLIVMLEYFDRTIQTSEHLERVTNLPTLAVIPEVGEQGAGYGYSYGYGGGGRRKRSRSSGGIRRAVTKTVIAGEQVAVELLPHDHPRLAAAEAYRGLRTALLLSSADELRTLAVTSANAGEGKSVTSANLAIVMSQLGHRVLLVDADLRRPRLHKMFELSNRIGLVSHLAGGADLDDVMQETAVPNLFVVPSGPIPPNPSELLSSKRMRSAIESMRSMFDFVIFDSPPSLAVTDSTILGVELDGVVLCFRAGKILREEARGCCERLQLAGVRTLGTVLNRFRPKPGLGRGYQYYYQAYMEGENASATDSAA